MKYKPLEITTTTHALAISIYILQVVQGCLYIIGFAQAISMSNVIGLAGTNAWAIALATSGTLAVVATHLAKNNPLPALRLEMWSAIVIAGASIWYEATLVIGNGIGAVVTTQSYAVMVAIGCIARVVQIRRELRKVVAVLSEPTTLTKVVADGKANECGSKR